MEGRVKVNGRLARKGSRLREGDLVELDGEPPASRFDPEPDTGLELTVVYQDAYLVVVDKPAGIACHPLRPEQRPTVAGALLARYPEMRGIGTDPREAGLVHRLDNDTSGLLMAARDRNTLGRLRSALKAGKIEKRYRALCAGQVGAPQQIRAWLKSDRGDRRRVKVVQQPGKRTRSAVTDIVESRPIGGFSLIEIRLHAAMRHQIRAHLGWLGHPLVGDALYGGPELPGLGRHFLHASRIRFSDPASGKPVDISSELPPELTAVLQRLG
jgi:23S rRNA pseudouridine1911/1915/1917 synthase